MEVYVFPVSQALLYPGFSKPFVVREEKYIQMFESALLSGIPVAVGMVYDGKKTYQYQPKEKLDFVHPIAGYGTPVIVERKKDGSIVVFIEGKGKVRLGEVSVMNPSYIICEAEKITENHTISQDDFQKFMLIHRYMMKWLTARVQDESYREQFINYIQTPEKVIGCFVSYIIVDLDLQQMIVDSDDINEKIRIIDTVIHSKGLVA